MADLGEELVGDASDGEDIDMVAPRHTARDNYANSGRTSSSNSAVKRKHPGHSQQKERRSSNQEKDKKSIDSLFGQAMFDRICESNFPKFDNTQNEEQTHLRVRFSPVEIADLADPAMQRLVNSLKPRLTFCFKGQAGSFRKKKGYASACVSDVCEWAELLSQLCQVHFAERKLEFSIACVNTKDGHKSAEGSFSLTMKRRDHMERLLQVIKDTPSSVKVNPECHLQVQDLPVSHSMNTLTSFLPFLPHAVQGAGYTAGEQVKGPINMCYRSQAQMEAVYNCFSDFKVAGHPLEVTKPRAIVPKASPSVTKEASGKAGDKADSIKKKTKDEPKKPKEEPKETPAPEEEEEAMNDIDIGEEDEEEYNDDDISCLARDLCSDMRDSLNKLKQLETDDPNLQRIMELQSTVDSTLLRLQKKKRSGSESGLSEGISEGVSEGSVVGDPWDPNEGTSQDKPSPSLTREERERHELTKLENLLEASDKQENKVKAAQEMELKAIKDQQEKQRSSWAKKILEDVKMNPGSSGVVFNQTAVKQEAQRLLMAREERLKARQAELARQRQEEEETMIQRDLNKQGASQVMLPFKDIISSGSMPSAMASPPSFVAQSTPQVKDSDKPEFMTLTEAEWLEMAPLGRPPDNARVEIQYHDKRSCPVTSCKGTRYFNSSKEFTDHWNLFHTEKMTVRFCSKCHAYFSTVDELWDHLRTRHGVEAKRDLEGLTQHARSKVIRNPSFREPWPFALSST